MGNCFSDAVEQALQYIYYDMGQGKGKEGFQLLEQASAAGDGDASCVLARCLNGYQYVWEGHGFPEDDERATRLLHKAVEQGSAMAVLICLRTGDLTPSMEENMPFANLQEAFDVVLRNAEQGDAFSQYVIGNSYFWWDFLRIQGKSAESFPDFEQFQAYLRENIRKCEDWFWKAFRGGIYFAGNNLNYFYCEGDEDLILPEPEKAKDLDRIGAERGYPTHEYSYGMDLQKEERYQEAVEWLNKAVAHGEGAAWYGLGCAYKNGQGVDKDLAKAAECFEKGLKVRLNCVGCHNELGAMYFAGEGVQQDYAKAYQLLIYAKEQGNNWGLDFLGACCFHGWGVQQDYRKAREFLEQITWNDPEVFYQLGCIYGQGLGVPADIKKGVAYLQKAGEHKAAREELLHYRKTFFGKWVRK